MKKSIFFTLLTFCALQLRAQSSVQVVREYINLLNNYFASGNLDYRDKIVNEILNPNDANGKRVTCRIDNKISQRIAEEDNNNGIDYITPARYITYLGRKNSDCGRCLRVYILKLKIEQKNEQNFVSAKINLLGKNGGEIIYNQFLIVGNGIAWILEDKNFELLDKIENNKTDTTALDVEDSVSKQKKQQNLSSHHEYVDLGLPSGTLWATCNVGANNPWEAGDYFAWGETVPKKEYNYGTHKYFNGDSYDKKTKYCSKSSQGDNGFKDNLTKLQEMDDAAIQNWGSEWNTPKITRWKELKNYCIWKWTTQNGKNGYMIKSKKNNNEIFLPAAGHCMDKELRGYNNNGEYWASTLNVYENMPNSMSF